MTRQKSNKGSLQGSMIPSLSSCPFTLLLDQLPLSCLVCSSVCLLSIYPSRFIPSLSCLVHYKWTDHLSQLLVSALNNHSNTPPDPVPEPPVVYKKSIIFFRSLFAYMRLLPAYQLYRQLKKQNHPLRIGFRVSRGQSPEESMFRESEIGIGKNLQRIKKNKDRDDV